MTCPKCNKKIVNNWNFCAYCQTPLREKCPECGEMEKIGRKFCETKVREVHAMFENHKFKGFWTHKLSAQLSYTFAISLAVFWIAISILYAANHKIAPYIWIPVTLVFTLAIIFSEITIFLIIHRKIQRKTMQDFLCLYPEYKEIIEYAKGEGS